MSVLDIIYISPQEFKLRGEHALKCEKIVETYAKLLSQYDCFTKPDLVMLKFPSTTKSPHSKSHGGFNSVDSRPRHDKRSSTYSSFKHGGGNHGNHPRQTVNNAVYSKNRPQLKALANIKGDPVAETARQLKGLLNIINKNNYSKISNKVRYLIATGSMETIIDTILDTACCQVFYISIFYRLLVDTINAAIDPDAFIASTRIDAFIETFIEEKQFLYFTSHCDKVQSESNYMQFCMLQKHKCLATSRNLVVFELLLNKHSSNWTVQSYFNFLLEHVSTLANSTEATETDIAQNIDTILCMAKDIKERYKNIKILHDIHKTISENEIGSKRLQFMVQDITRT